MARFPPIAAVLAVLLGALCWLGAPGPVLVPPLAEGTPVGSGDPVVPVVAAPGTPRVDRRAEPATNDAASQDIESSTALLCGRVVDEAGWPVAGARVGLQLLGRGPCHESVPAEVRTGIEGRFAFGATQADRTLRLIVHSEGFAPAVVDHVLPSGPAAAAGTDLGDLTLAAGGAVAGRVVAKDGMPIGDAAWHLVPVTGPLARLPAALRACLLAERAVHADGTFATGDLPEGAYLVEAAAPGRERRRSPRFAIAAGRVTPVGPLVLGDGHTLGGGVFDPRGVPVVGAVVEVLAQGEHAGEAQSTVTDGDGTFVVAHLPARPHHLRVRAPGWRPLRLSGVRPDDRGHLAVHLEPGASLRGRVRGAAGSPLPGCTVRTTRLVEVATGGAAPGDVGAFDRLLAEAERFRPALAWNPRAQTMLEETLIQLAQLDERRRRALLQQYPFGAARPEDWQCIAAADGAFAFHHLDAGRYAVEVQAPGLPPQCFGPFPVGSGGPSPSIELRLTER